MVDEDWVWFGGGGGVAVYKVICFGESGFWIWAADVSLAPLRFDIIPLLLT